MEPKFINQFEVTPERLWEWYKHPVGKLHVRGHKKLMILYSIVLCCGVYMLASGFFSLHRYSFMFVGLFVIIVALLQWFLTPRLMIKKQYAMMLKSKNSAVWRRNIIFSDEIYCEDGNQTTRRSYSELVKVTEDGEYFYLLYQSELALRVPKDSFVKGTAEEFRAFITQKAEVK